MMKNPERNYFRNVRTKTTNAAHYLIRPSHRHRQRHHKKQRRNTVQIEYDHLAQIYDDRWKDYTKASLVGQWDHIEQPLHDWLLRYNNEQQRQQRPRKDEKEESAINASRGNIDDDYNEDQITMVDLGCGTGALAFFMARQFPEWHIMGLEPSENMITLAVEHQRRIVQYSKSGNAYRGNKDDSNRDNDNINADHNAIDFIHASCCGGRLPFHDESIDCVATLSSFHFWECQQDALKEIWRILKPGGLFVLTDWCGDFMACQLCGFAMKVNVCRHYPPQDYHMLQLSTVQKQLKKANFVILHVFKYHIASRIAKIGPRWGMMTFVAIKE